MSNRFSTPRSNRIHECTFFFCTVLSTSLSFPHASNSTSSSVLHCTRNHFPFADFPSSRDILFFIALTFVYVSNVVHVVASRGGGGVCGYGGGMEAADIVPVLQERVATVPGGRDLDGRPLLVVVVQPTWTNGRLDTALRYCSSLFRYVRMRCVITW